MAIDIRYVGHARREPVDRGELQRDQHHRERVLRRVPAGDGEPAGQPRRRPRRDVRVHRAGHGHVAAADLSRVLQRHRATSNNPAAYTGSELDERHVRRPAGRTQPEPYDAAGDLDGNAARRGQRGRSAGLPANFFVAQSGRRDRRGRLHHLDQRRVQRLRRAADRDAAPAVDAGSRSTAATSTRSRTARPSSASTTAASSNPTANVRHAIKMQWDWSVPVGRGRRFGTDMNPCARRRASAAGSSTAPAASRRAT